MIRVLPPAADGDLLFPADSIVSTKIADKGMRLASVLARKELWQWI